MIDSDAIRERFTSLSPHLDERGRRLFAATEANSAGYGGIAAVTRITGIAASTIGRGLGELAQNIGLEAGRLRRPGGGRKPLVAKDPGLLPALLALVEPTARGDPMSTLRWTCKSLRRLAAELTALGHPVSHTVVGELLTQQKFSLQANRKTREGGDHPDRDAQFLHIEQSVADALAAKQPVISVDTKKKELVGDFKNAGREWRPKGSPVPVRVHDFKDEGLGKVNPYGVFDIAGNAGWVSVGIDADTAEFAVAAIRSWWEHLGAQRYPDARALTITTDCGGSNGNRLRLWKTELQRLADETSLAIRVCHFPPGTSKWNKIEHRLFTFITRNWRGQPLVSRQAIVSLIGATTSSAGLEVHARLDERSYERGVKVSDAQLAAVNLTRDEFRPEWTDEWGPVRSSFSPCRGCAGSMSSGV